MQLVGGFDKDWQVVQARGRAISWTNINMFQVAAAHEDGSAHDLYLDSIRITR